jgi:hypothetical protein
MHIKLRQGRSTQVGLWAAVLLFSHFLAKKRYGQNADDSLNFEPSLGRRLDAPDLRNIQNFSLTKPRIPLITKFQ